MRRTRIRNLTAALVVALMAATLAPLTAAAPAGAAVPSGFQDSAVITGLTEPTAMRFAPDGRIFVAEKSGLVKEFDGLTDTSATTVIDLRVEVYNFWDRGLLGFVLDPNFGANGYAYAIYTRNANVGGTAPKYASTPSNDPTSESCSAAQTTGCTVSGRVVRFTVGANSVAVTGSLTTLVDGWCQQFPSHSVGDLEFGPDGMLYVTGGDGASFDFADYGQTQNPCGDPPGAAGTNLTAPNARGGALRSQSIRRPAADPTVLNGTVLRINPATGTGVVGNPSFADATADANKKRIIAAGLRNPFRLTVRPGTSELWVGDVGWDAVEEIDRITSPTPVSAVNFGWPCYEGTGRQVSYQDAGTAMCTDLYNAPTGTVTDPYFSYRHYQEVSSGDASVCDSGANTGGDHSATAGSSVSGLAFAPTTGTNYPVAFQGALFFADYARQCIWYLPAGSGGLPDKTKPTLFESAAKEPVDLVVEPTSGDLFYVGFASGVPGGGSIHRIRYTAGTQPAPVARIVTTPSPATGAAPLNVAFNGGTSTGQGLTYAWDLGSGTFTDSTSPTPGKTFPAGTTTVRLRVTDTIGRTDTASVTVNAGAPPTATIATPTTALTWQVGDTINFSGSAVDGAGQPLPASALTWSTIIHHCVSADSCHSHSLGTFAGVAGGSFSAPDHPYPSYLELRLVATDAAGLTDSKSVEIQPRTTTLTLASNPPGMNIASGSSSSAAPYTQTVLQNTTAGISAPLNQTVGGVNYVFDSWSDGGAASHTVNVTAPTTITATYKVDASGPATVPPPSAGGWKLNGSSAMVGTALRLTTTTKNQVGTAFWPTALNPATTTIEFDAALSGGTGGPSGGGDGLAFVIADATANTPSALGVNGGGLGYSGIKGLAVALDTFGGATDPADNFLGITNGWNTPNTDDLKWLATNTTVPKFRTATRHVTITIAAGRIKVKIGTTQYLDIAATLPASAYLGFSAANGDYTDNHTITNVVITNG